MVRAATLMREKRAIKIAAIASAFGYESESSFGKVFRRIMGISPGKYRQFHIDAKQDAPEQLPRPFDIPIVRERSLKKRVLTRN